MVSVHAYTTFKLSDAVPLLAKTDAKERKLGPCPEIPYRPEIPSLTLPLLPSLYSCTATMITTATYHHHSITITTCQSQSLSNYHSQSVWNGGEMSSKFTIYNRKGTAYVANSVYVCDVNSSDGLREGTVLLWGAVQLWCCTRTTLCLHHSGICFHQKPWHWQENGGQKEMMVQD